MSLEQQFQDRLGISDEDMDAIVSLGKAFVPGISPEFAGAFSRERSSNNPTTIKAVDSPISYMSQTEKDAWVTQGDAILAKVLWGRPESFVPPTEDELLRRRLKIAYVLLEDDSQVMLFVDNETFTGYKMNEAYPTLFEPLTIMPYKTFSRWCTTMDL